MRLLPVILKTQGLLLFAVLLASSPVLSAAGLTGDPPLAEGTRKMVALLQKVFSESNPLENTFQNNKRVDLFRGQLEEADTPSKTIDLQVAVAQELLNAGRSEEALIEFQKLEATYQKLLPESYERNKLFIKTRLGMCMLRIGEQENCILNHGSDSCLMPIQGNGVHKLTRGSRGAIEMFTNTLKEFPGDLRSRWLLNIACMTLGEYPDKVPDRWRIPPKVFDSAYDIKRFKDIAAEAGLDIEKLSGATVAEDLDGDGFLDIVTTSIGFGDQMRFFHNNGDGTFSDRSRQAGLTGLTGGLNIVVGDYNNDGFPDLFVLRGAWMGKDGAHPNSLLKNNGDGTFEDVTIAAGVLSFHPTQTGVWFDYNNDGLLDLFIGNESAADFRHPCELFRNNGDGTFTECAAQAGVAHVGFVKASISGDFNNDGLPDLYLSCRGEPNVLFMNQGAQSPNKDPKGPWKFTDAANRAGVVNPYSSFTTFCFDYDNDGYLDIFCASYPAADVSDIVSDYLGIRSTAERAHLYRNRGDGTFEDVTKRSGLYKILLAMSANFGDLDNDGWLDFYLGTGDPDLSTLIPNKMFRNNEGKGFQDVTTSGGFGHLQKGHAIAFADVDNDGDQDVFLNAGGAYTGDIARNALFENPGHSNHWINVRLEGTKSNRSAIGARIKVNLTTDKGPRQIHRLVSTGGSFGANPLRQEIGLGQASEIKSIEIFWPVTGQTQSIAGLKMDRFYKIVEGNNQPAELKLKTFQFGKNTVGSMKH